MIGQKWGAWIDIVDWSIKKWRAGTDFVKWLVKKWGAGTKLSNIHVSLVVVSAIFVFPSHKKQCVYLSKAYCYFLWEKKFLAVRRVGLMTHREYRVDRPFPVTWLGNVWEPNPPPSSMGLSRLFNPRFPGLMSDTVTLSHGSVISSFWFSLIYIYIIVDVIPHCKFKIGA